MAVPHYPSGTPSRSWTFANFRDWANARSPGAGDEFIAWVRANNDVPAQYSLNLNSSTFGPGGLGSNNTAAAWFATWIAQAIVGPAIGAKLQEGVQAGAGLIPKALKGVAEGIGQVPGAKALSGLDAIGNFFSQLGQANTWIRIGEVLLGIVLIGIGLARITGTQNAVSSIVKARIP